MTDRKHPAGEQLQAYHDGELEHTVASEVASHCESCESCRAVLAELDQLNSVMASAPTPELPHSIWPLVQSGRQRETGLPPIFAYAACAVGILIGILLGPIQFSTEEVTTDLAWSETVTVWNQQATSSLLSVYQSGLE